MHLKPFPEKGEIIIRTKNTDSSSVRLEYRTNGSGIPPEDIPHIFQPFFSTKRNARGIGLGPGDSARNSFEPQRKN
jgi:signal transduction histidine kinase